MAVGARSLIFYVGVCCLCVTLCKGFDFWQCISEQGKSCEDCIDECKALCDQGDTDCQNSCENKGNDACDCINESNEEGKCKRPSKENKQSTIKAAGLLAGASLVDAVPGRCDKNCMDETCKCEVGPPGTVNGKRKKRLAFPFDPKFIWHQDTSYTSQKKDKLRKCCLTTRRTVPFTWKVTDHVYPVYCPLAGGYQWIDQVVCDVGLQDRGSYQVHFPSRRKCPYECQRVCTWRVYLVTNLPPYGFWGHCFYYFTPTWFARVEVPSHCYCPAIHPQGIPNDQKCYHDAFGSGPDPSKGQVPNH